MRRWILRNKTVIVVGMMSAGIPLLVISFVLGLGNSTAKPIPLAIAAGLLTIVLSIPAAVPTLALAVRWQMKRSVSFDETFGVIKWQFWIAIADFFVTPVIFTLGEAFKIDHGIIVLVAVVNLFVLLPLIQTATLKSRLRIGWMKAYGVLTAQGFCLIAGLLICAGIVSTLALMARFLTRSF